MRRLFKRVFPTAFLWAKYIRDIRALPRPWAPRTFNEHIVWRLAHLRDPIIQEISDKVEVRKYVAEVIGERFLVPQLGVFSDAEVIRALQLPPKFVMKASFSSGKTKVITSTNDADDLVRTARQWLASRFDEPWQTWLYGRYPRRIIIEEFIGRGNNVPQDYKFFVFGGEVKFIQVDQDRFGDHVRTLVTPDWRMLPCSYHYPAAKNCPRPVGLQAMLDAAARLANGFDFMRVDLYDVDGVIYFGELSPFPERGSRRFFPEKYDAALGRLFSEPGLEVDEMFRE